MARMVRKQIYIDATQDEQLKMRASALGVTESELIRRGIDGVLGAVGSARDPRAWEHALSFMEERLARDVPRVRRSWTRDDAYDHE